MGKKAKSGLAGFKEAFNDLTCNISDAIEGTADFLKDLVNPVFKKKDESSNRLLSDKDGRSDANKKKSIINLRNRRKVHDISAVVPLADISEDVKTKVAIKRAAKRYGLVGEPKQTKKQKYKAPKKQPSFENKLPVIKEEKEPETDSVITQVGKPKEIKETPSILDVTKVQREDIFKDIANKEAKKNIPRVTQTQRDAIFNSIKLEEASQNVYKDLENQNSLKSTLPKNKNARKSGTTKDGNSWVKYTEEKTKKSGQIAEI